MLQYFYWVTIELVQYIAAHDLGHVTRRSPAADQIHEMIEYGQQGVHIVRRN